MIEPEKRSGLGWPTTASARSSRNASAREEDEPIGGPQGHGPEDLDRRGPTRGVARSAVGWPDEMVPDGPSTNAEADDSLADRPETEDEMSQTTESTPTTGPADHEE